MRASVWQRAKSIFDEARRLPLAERTTLVERSCGGDKELLDMLVRAGANVSVATREGSTPLWLASINGDAPMIEALISAGAKPNDPLPHEAFYDSFVAQGVTPPDIAQNALEGIDDVSITLIREDKPFTVAHSGLLALEADELQYERGYGPCIDAGLSGLIRTRRL